MRKCFYYCTWQMCQLLCGYAELQLHPNQNIYGSSSCPRCNLLRFNGTTLWLCKTFWKETHITQEPHNEQGFFMFYHTAFKIWVHQEGKMQIAFGFLFKKKKKKEGDSERRWGKEGSTPEAAEIYSCFTVIRISSLLLQSGRTKLSQVFVPLASLTGVSVDGVQVISMQIRMCDQRYVFEWQTNPFALFGIVIQSVFYVYHIFYIVFSWIHVNLIIHLIYFLLSLEA